MVFRALKLRMIVILADLALVNLIRPHDILIFVLHVQEEMVVHFTRT